MECPEHGPITRAFVRHLRGKRSRLGAVLTRLEQTTNWVLLSHAGNNVFANTETIVGVDAIIDFGFNLTESLMTPRQITDQVTILLTPNDEQGNTTSEADRFDNAFDVTIIVHHRSVELTDVVTAAAMLTDASGKPTKERPEIIREAIADARELVDDYDYIQHRVESQCQGWESMDDIPPLPLTPLRKLAAQDEE